MHLEYKKNLLHTNFQTHLWTKRGQFKDALDGEEEGEDQVERNQHVHEYQGGALKLEHQQQGVQYDQQQDAVLEWSWRNQPPNVVPKILVDFVLKIFPDFFYEKNIHKYLIYKKIY